MALNFPNSPSPGETYTDGNTTWTWNSTSNTWSSTGIAIANAAIAGTLNTQILFNDNGIANGSANLVFNKSTGLATITNKLTIGSDGGSDGQVSAVDGGYLRLTAAGGRILALNTFMTSNISTNFGDMTLATQIDGGGSEVMRLTTTGSVGIGISPTEKLHVKDGSVLIANGVYGSYGGVPELLLRGSAGGSVYDAYGRIRFSASGSFENYGATIAGYYGSGIDTGGLIFYTGQGATPTPTMLLGTNGSLIVGANAIADFSDYFSHKFVANGTAFITGNVRLTHATNWIEWRRTATNAWRLESNGVGAILTIVGNQVTIPQDLLVQRAGLTVTPTTATTSATKINHTWNTGGTTFASLHINTTATSFEQNSRHLLISNSSSNIFGVSANGFVSIGHDNPQYLLHVDGTINASSVLINGSPISASTSGAKIVLKPEAASFPTSNPAQYKSVAGTNFPVESLAFDASTEESCYFKFDSVGYSSGSLTVTFNWYADSATSGGVVWEAALAVITPNSDTQDIETKAFATAQNVSDSHLGTTGQRLHSVDLTLSNTDSIAENDYCVLKISRKPADASDTMTGDALLTGVRVTYS